MSNRLNPALISRINEIDYMATFYAGGGARGIVIPHLLDFFERETGLPTLHLFPIAAAGSVGTMAIGALYTRHPEYKNAPRMSARQFLEIFPKVAARLPENVNLIRNKPIGGCDPLMDAVATLIGDAKLSDVLGTVSLSTHKIEGAMDSYVAFNKFVNPKTGEETYPDSDPDKKLIDIIRMSIALPVLFTPHEGHMDIAFAQSPSPFLIKVAKMYGIEKKGGFTYFGNFRQAFNDGAKHFQRGGALPVILAATDEIDNGVLSQTIQSANALFEHCVIALEQFIHRDTPNAPSTRANVATPEQFEKIRVMTEAYIEENIEVLTALALRLKTLALERIERAPETAFGIEPRVQKFPLPDLPVYTQPKPVREGFANAASGTVRLTRLTASTTADIAVRIATSEPVKKMLRDMWNTLMPGLRMIDEARFPQVDLSQSPVRAVPIENDSGESRFDMP